MVKDDAFVVPYGRVTDGSGLVSMSDHQTATDGAVHRLSYERDFVVHGITVGPDITLGDIRGWDI